ncbi:hypothetical protein FACS1894211_14300 [Clostridia bacterium]|nr:hypothetical protein FACS1894211_14300 [Clostridia bacterium]
MVADDEAFQFNHIYNPFQNINTDKDFAFELTYVSPRLTRFEKDYIHIDEPKIIAEVERINKALAQDRAEISELVNKINALLTKIGQLVEQEENRVRNAQDKHFAIIGNIQRKISRRCFFLRNDNGRLLFNDARYQM